LKVFSPFLWAMYAIDENGDYSIVPSVGWDPLNFAYAQRMELARQRIEESRKKVEAGQASPLLYYMAAYQWNQRELARYTGFFQWQIRRHQRAEVFRRLKRSVLERYARIFNLSVEALLMLPETDLSPRCAS
jgi:hypothetical protein